MAAIRPLFSLPFYSIRKNCPLSTRLSQEVITVSSLFNCKIFLQFHPVSEISEMRVKRVYFSSLPFCSIRTDSIRPVFLGNYWQSSFTSHAAIDYPFASIFSAASRFW
nr:MAG TPA: hypothetical protein [Caudoviricetes sp.]